MAILALSGVDFQYDEHEQIFSDFSLVFQDIQATAIVGQNGAGKTTLVKLIKGLLRPQQGAILYEDTDLATRSVAEIARFIGLVFQNPDDQIFKHNVLDEVMYGPLNIGFSSDEAKQAAEKALAAVGLTDVLAKHPYDLSFSQRKRVAIASIIAMDPAIIIFDEPTIGQDATGKEQIKAIIADLKARGKLVITIIHDMDFVAENFERVVILGRGQVLADGDPLHVFQQKKILQAAYLEAPQIMSTAESLGYPPHFLTVADFVQGYKQKKQK